MFPTTDKQKWERGQALKYSLLNNIYNPAEAGQILSINGTAIEFISQGEVTT